MSPTPEAGQPLTIEDLDMILEAVAVRHNNFPNEPMAMTFMLVMFNIGDRFSPVECTNGEWSGLKKDVGRTGDLPTCPDGHPLTQGPGLKLGWLKDE